MSNKTLVSEIKDLSFDQFLSIDDEEVKNYLFATKFIVSAKYDRVVFENDKKIAFYIFSKAIKRSPKRKFYVKNSLCEWIIYEKDSGRVKISPNHKSIKEYFIFNYFNNPGMILQIFPIFRINKIFIKRVIENKINTLHDILEYIKSYIVKNKKISTDIIYEMCSRGILRYSILELFNDPENLNFDEFLSREEEIMDFYNKFYIKIDVSQIKDIRKISKDYEKRQTEKLIEIL